MLEKIFYLLSAIFSELTRVGRLLVNNGFPIVQAIMLWLVRLGEFFVVVIPVLVNGLWQLRALVAVFAGLFILVGNYGPAENTIGVLLIFLPILFVSYWAIERKKK